MSVRASIVLLSSLLLALGLGYVAYVEQGSNLQPPATEAALDDTAEPSGQGQLPASTEQALTLGGSSDRRMDDFGAGPSGTVVTVPLKDRHRQAFAGQTSGAGGGAPPRLVDGELTEEGAATGPAITVERTSESLDQAGDGLASANQAKSTEVGDKEIAKASSYRVIERKPAAESATGATGVDTGDAPGSEAVVSSPSFDIVRVSPEGNAVLAGRAAPFAEVEVRVGEDVIDRVTATALGEWVSTPLQPLASGDQELSLTALSGDQPAVPSRQVVVVSIPEPAEQQVAEATGAVAVIVDKDKGGEGRILQAPGTLRGGDDGLALKLVDYDDEGAIKLSGEAPPGVPIRIYIDNEPAALVIGDSKGYWITTLDRDLPGGDYTLRLDQLDKKGETVARLETPLTRVTTPPVKGEAKVDYIVVQPGNSLWRIARRLSGDGFNYVYIFEANEGQIRDPDVIYPGQVFEVPLDGGIAG